MNIIIVGANHSFTSAVAKYYIDKGYKLSSRKKQEGDYDIYEPDYSVDNDFDYLKLAHDINTHDRHVYKLPLLPMVYDKLLPLLEKEHKFIYVIRNPIDIISSSIEKSGRSPDYYLLRIAHLYEMVLNSGIKHEIVMGEWFVENRKKRSPNWKLSRRFLKIWQLFSK